MGKVDVKSGKSFTDDGKMRFGPFGPKRPKNRDEMGVSLATRGDDMDERDGENPTVRQCTVGLLKGCPLLVSGFLT